MEAMVVAGAGGTDVVLVATLAVTLFVGLLAAFTAGCMFWWTLQGCRWVIGYREAEDSSSLTTFST